MEEIEKATGKRIIRIETNDLDEMEEVCTGIVEDWREFEAHFDRSK